MKWILGARSGTWPVVTADAKTQLGIDSGVSTFDTELDELIEAACMKFEKDTGRYVKPIAIEARYQSWPSQFFKFQYGPLTACTIKYTDEDGDEQTVDNTGNVVFNIRAFDYGSEVILRADWTKPDVDTNLAYPIELELTFGAAAPDDVPTNEKQAIKVKTADLFETKINGVRERRTLYDSLIEPLILWPV